MDLDKYETSCIDQPLHDCDNIIINNNNGVKIIIIIIITIYNMYNMYLCHRFKNVLVVSEHRNKQNKQINMKLVIVVLSL